MNFRKRLFSMILGLMLLCSCLTVTAFAAPYQMIQGIGLVENESLSLYAKADSHSKILAQPQPGEWITVIGAENDWLNVRYNELEGAIPAEDLPYLTAENVELGWGNVNRYNVLLRSGPDITSPVVKTVGMDARCYVIGVNNGWYKVIHQDNICYIRSDFLTLAGIPCENQGSGTTPIFFRQGKSTGIAPDPALLAVASSATGGTSLLGITGDQILEEAEKYLGVRYRNGGATPDGFDCSGYVYYVLQQMGYAPYRSPADQFHMGTEIEKSEMEPGDLVFFAGTGAQGISHVGIYAGDGQFIHAPNSRTVVSFSDLTSGYWAIHFYGARRMG